MRTLREVIFEFKQTGKAVGHFNVSDSNQLEALAEAAKETGLPVIVGLSEGEREFYPLTHARAAIDAYKKEGIEMFLNADHTYTKEKVMMAIEAGVDSAVVDGAKLSLEENIALMQACVLFARNSGRDVVMEGELGYIGQSSKPLDALPEGVTLENLTAAADAVRFVGETGADCFAPSVGNIHGMLKNATEPRLHPERVKEIADATGVPLVLHGASGNTIEDIHACIKAGVSVVHINTELRVLYRKGLEESLKQNPAEVAPYKILHPAVAEMKHFVADKLRAFAFL